MDKFTTRGLLYAALSSIGMGYELLFTEQPRLFLVCMYGAVVVLGLILIFFVEDKTENSTTV